MTEWPTYKRNNSRMRVHSLSYAQQLPLQRPEDKVWNGHPRVKPRWSFNVPLLHTQKLIFQPTT
jgi:hypothetical protein